MAPPLSIRRSPIDIGGIWDEEMAGFNTMMESIAGSKLIVVDKLLLNQLKYSSILKDNSSYLALSKEEIECNKECVIFICQSVVSTTRLIGYQIRKLRERNSDIQFHIFFTPAKTLMCSQCLREETVFGYVTLHSLYLSLFPLEDDVVSMEIDNCFERLYLKEDKTMIPSIVKTIISFQQTCGTIHEMHAIGEYATTIMESIQKQKNSILRNSKSSKSIRHFIIIDRAIDFNSLFVTPLTYEGLIGEILPIHVGSTFVDASVVGRKGDEKVKIDLNNDDYMFSEIRDLNILKIAQETADGKKKIYSKEDSFDQLQIHQGISDLITDITNGYLFRQRWQMEREILEGENLLDYIVERITLQDPIQKVLRLLVLFSLVNGGLKGKDYDTVRRELIQTYGYENLLYLYNLENSGLLVRRDGGKNYSALRNKLQLVKGDIDGSNSSDMHYVTSGYAPISTCLVEILLNEGKLSTDITRIVGCNYDNSILKEGTSSNGKPIVVVFFVGGVTFMEIAALRYLKKKENFPYELIVLTTNITNGDNILDQLRNKAPLNLPVANMARREDINPF